MALSDTEFQELQQLLGVPAAPVGNAGRGAFLTGVTSPNQFIAAQRAAQQQQQAAAEKKQMEEQGWLGYTGGKALDVLTGRAPEGNVVSNLVTGGLTRAASLFGSPQAQAQLAQADINKRREEELRTALEGETSLPQRIAQNVAGMAQYAVQEPSMFASQMVAGMADPALLAIGGGLGAPIKGASTAANLARMSGAGGAAAGVQSAAQTFGEGALNLPEAVEAAGTGVATTAGLGLAGKAAMLPVQATGKVVSTVKDALMPSKQSLPTAMVDLMQKSPEVAQNFELAANLKKQFGEDFKPSLGEITKEVAATHRAQEAAANNVDAIAKIRANRTTSENALQTKLNTEFPASSDVLGSMGREVSDKTTALAGLSTYLNEAETTATNKFLSGMTKQGMELGQDVKAIRDAAKASSKSFYDTAFNYLKTEGDINQYGFDANGMNRVTNAIAEASKRSDVASLPKPLTDAFAILEQYKNEQRSIPFSAIDDLSKQVNNEVSIQSRLVSMGDSTARLNTLPALEIVKSALDNEISKLPGDFGQRYRAMKAEYGVNYMEPFYKGIGGKLSARNKYGDQLADSAVYSKFMSPETINQFFKLSDRSPAAVQAVNNAVVQNFLQKSNAISKGVLNPEAATEFIRQNADVFKALPELTKQFKDATVSLDGFARARANAKAATAALADSTASRLMSKARLQDVFYTSETGAFTQPAKLSKLLEVAKKDSSGTELKGIQREMIDVALSKSKPVEFMQQNQVAFKKAFGQDSFDVALKYANASELLGKAIDVTPGEAVKKNMLKVGVGAGVTGALSVAFSPFMGISYAVVHSLVNMLRNRKTAKENAGFMEVFSNPELGRELITGMNKARMAINTNNPKGFVDAASNLKRLMITNGITMTEPTPETTSIPTAAPASIEAPAQGLSDQELEELKQLLPSKEQPKGPAKEQVSSIISDEAEKLGIGEHTDLLMKLAKQESGYKQSALSPVGAIGVMQLMPNTAKELGVNPNDLEDNVRGGVRYWAQMLKKFKDVRLATAAYNAGPGNVMKAGNKVPNIPETINYVKAILG